MKEFWKKNPEFNVKKIMGCLQKIVFYCSRALYTHKPWVTEKLRFIPTSLIYILYYKNIAIKNFSIFYILYSIYFYIPFYISIFNFTTRKEKIYVGLEKMHFKTHVLPELKVFFRKYCHQVSAIIISYVA